ncbi:MAG: hypothetical protein JXR78_01775 [Victivallales bacterium]|nr:hypothetical protein [Victivallales bacterium]
MKHYSVKASNWEEEVKEHICPVDELRERWGNQQQEELFQNYRHSRQDTVKLMEILARTPTAKDGSGELCIDILPIF